MVIVALNPKISQIIVSTTQLFAKQACVIHFPRDVSLKIIPVPMVSRVVKRDRGSMTRFPNEVDGILFHEFRQC